MSWVLSPPRAPHLVVDSTVGDTSDACSIPERCTLPGVQDARGPVPLRNHDGLLCGFHLDAKSAHETIRVREEDQMYVRHALLDFVDDFLCVQGRETILALLLLMFCCMLGVPSSYFHYVDRLVI